MATLDRIAPEIPVDNLSAALEYYVSKLAFEIVSEYPAGNYAIVQRDDVAIHLFEDTSRANRVGIHIFTAALEDLHNELKARGASLTQEIELKPWGNRDFRVTDPSGNEIKFTEPVAVVV